MPTAGIELPAPCWPGQHTPAIVHRTGGKDARYHNRCARCGHEIIRTDDEPEWRLVDDQLTKGGDTG